MNRFKTYLMGLVCIWASTGALAAHAQAMVEYIHTDALGTPIAVTDANRGVIELSEYEPFGQLLNRPLKDGPAFTGHVQDSVTGLTYMQQRYYDPMLGRFLSADPVTAYSTPGSNFNRYSYANNNPFVFTDPDGRVAQRKERGSLCSEIHQCESGSYTDDELIAQNRGRRSGGGSGSRTSRYDVRSTEEATWLIEGRYFEVMILRLDPGRTLPQFVGSPTGPIYNRATNELLRRELNLVRSEYSERIATHGYKKHVVERGEYPGYTREGYRNHAQFVMTFPTATRVRKSDGSIAYWHAPSSSMVIVNPRAPDRSTMFRPSAGAEYFERFGR